MEEKGTSLYLIRNYLYYSMYSGGLVGQQAGLLGSLGLMKSFARLKVGKAVTMTDGS
jgi:hypothetical protein